MKPIAKTLYEGLLGTMYIGAPVGDITLRYLLNTMTSPLTGGSDSVTRHKPFTPHAYD